MSTRTFESGATRNADAGKHDYEGFLSPRVLERFAQYMTKHRHLEDGTVRDSDNWQKGIPRDAYIKSAWRHFMDVWKQHRGLATEETLEDALCALLFNIQGYLHETLVAPRMPETQSPLLTACLRCGDTVEGRDIGHGRIMPALHPCKSFDIRHPGWIRKGLGGVLLAVGLFATTANAATVRLDGPQSWCVAVEGTRPQVVCDTVYPDSPPSGPAYHVRWSVSFGGAGGLHCIRWELYRPAVAGQPELILGSDELGKRCP